MRNFLIEPQAGEPAPRQVHAQLFHQLALTGDSVQVADQQDAQQQFGIDGWPPAVAIAILQFRSYKIEADVAVNQAQKMVLRNLIFDPEIVEQRLRAGVMSHHEQQASERGNVPQHHELWPAYNLTFVPEQASSQVLFQQQRNVTP